MNRKKIYKMLVRLGIVLYIISFITIQVATAMPLLMVKEHGNYFYQAPRIQAECRVNNPIDKIIENSIEYGENNNKYIDKMVKAIIKSKESYEVEIKKAESRLPKVNVEKYNQYDEINMLTGKVAGQYAPHTWFLNRLNNLARDKGQKLNVFSGYRSNKLQGYLFNKSDRSGKMVAPPGKSRHNAGLAVDCDGWAKKLTNKELAKYGLYKPMSYEDWHIEPIETKGKSTKEIIVKYGLPKYYTVKK